MIDYHIVESSEMVVFKAGNGRNPVGCVHLDKRTGEVFGLIISSDYREMGIAKELLNRVHTYVANGGYRDQKIWGWVTPDNKESQNLFHSLGYAEGVYFEKEIPFILEVE